MGPEPFRATAGQLRALLNWRKRPIIRGPGIEGEYEFEAFIEFANRYFSRSFTMNHILPNLQLLAEIKVHSQNANVAKVKMVMSMSMVKGKPKGGDMITSNWMDVVRQNGMKVNEKYVFWFHRSQDGGLKLLVDSV
ncbi:hypothetical protein ACQ4PT_066856 [Festuca glaucescens]